MATPQATPEEPKKKNYLLWGCLIILVLMCLVIGCLVTVVGLSMGGIDPLGLDLDYQIDQLNPWQDYFEEPYNDPFYEDKDIAPDDDVEEPDNDPTYEDKDIAPDDNVEEPSTDSVPGCGFTQLVPFNSDNFTFSFFYPEGWDVEEDEHYENVNFYDPDSNSSLSVGRDWLCQGCSTAADAATRFKDNLKMESMSETFVVIEDSPYDVSSGEDAHIGAYEWVDTEGYYSWVYAVFIYVKDPVEDMSVYFIMWGDDTADIEICGELFKEVVASYKK